MCKNEVFENNTLIDDNSSELVRNEFDEQKVRNIKQWDNYYPYFYVNEMATSLRKVIVPDCKLFESPLKYVAGGFYKCCNLQKISHRIFENCDNATSFAHTFDGCDLMSIDTYWFRNSPKLNNLKAAFQGYKGKKIPKTLFLYNSKITNIDRIFHNAFFLENIPSELFKFNKIVSANASFKNCFAINDIPSGLFDTSSNSLENVNWIFAIGDELKVKRFLGPKEIPQVRVNNIIPFWEYLKVKKDDNYRPYQNLIITSEIPEGWN